MRNQILYEIVNKLGFLEKKVLFLIKDKSKPRDILFLLNKQKKKYAYTTIMTIMDKLYKKGFLTRRKMGKTYYYSLKTPLENLKTETSFYLTKNLISLFSPFQVFKNLIYLSLFVPFFDLVNSFLNNSMISGAFFILLTFSFFNLILNWYLNGFFEYLLMIINEPTILFRYLSINFAYFQETITSTSLLLIIFGSFFLLKKFSKIRYQLRSF